MGRQSGVSEGWDVAASARQETAQESNWSKDFIDILLNNIEPALTCYICQRRYLEATTITECQHTFCRKCIYKKVVDEKSKNCPQCNTDLGRNPVDSLRPDRSRKCIREAFLPYIHRKKDKAPEAESGSLTIMPVREIERKKDKAPEAESGSLTNMPVRDIERKKDKAPEAEFGYLTNMPVREIEISSPSLVVDTPHVAIPKGLTGRRTKSVPRRVSALHELGPIISDSGKKRHETLHKVAENLYSSENSKKVVRYRRQTPSHAEMSNDIPDKDKESAAEPIQVKAEQLAGADGEANTSKTRAKEDPNRLRVHEEYIEKSQSSSLKGKAKKLQGRKRKDSAAATPLMLEAANIQHHRQINPIWFSLAASLDQTGYPPLPQIPTIYLRIKDGNIPASFICKYLVKKLELASETEVEIICRGQMLDPTMSLNSVLEKWLSEGTSQKLQATIGSSAEEFIMALTYRRAKNT